MPTRRSPPLEAAEERELVARARGGSLPAMDRLLAAHRGFVVTRARALAAGVLPVEDLVQEGFIGFIEGIRRFEPERARGGRLLTYARRWIDRAIRRAVQRGDLRYGGMRLPEEVYYALGRSRRGERSPRSAALEAIGHRRMSRILEGDEEPEGGGDVVSTLADPGAGRVLEELIRREQRSLMRQALQSLPAAEREALRDRRPGRRAKATEALREAFLSLSVRPRRRASGNPGRGPAR